MGIRTSKEPDYQILEDHGEIQIREYPPLWIAETLINADYVAAGNLGFQRLAGYIFGGNLKKQSLAMTTPVFRETTGEPIAMTAPVIQQAVDHQWRMAFVMPAGYDEHNLPVPVDPQVMIKSLPARKVAVLRYSGSLNLASITKNSQRLLDWLSQHQRMTLSSPRSAAYDPPWTIPALRRNEIHIDIE